MKKLFSLFLASALFFASASLLKPERADAVVAAAVSSRILFSQSNVTTTAWLTVVNQTARAIKGISILNTSPVPLELAIGASAGELVQIIVPSAQASGTGLQYGVAPFFFPLAISQGTKVAVRALNSNGAAGELQSSFFYY